MSRFEDNLWESVVDRRGDELAHADARRRARSRRLRPRMLAGSTLGLAGVGAALVVALSTSATTPAFAVTKTGDGSVLVKLNYLKMQNLPQINAKLVAMGTGEQVTIYEAAGPATVSGPVTCAPGSGVSGPSVEVLDGKDGTTVIAPGQSSGNTAEGTFHLDRCVTSRLGSGNSGNSGAG